MKRKFIVSILCLAVFCSFSLPCFADDTTIETGTTTGSIEAYAEFTESYVITIPSSVEIKSTAEGKFFTISVSNLLLEAGHKLTIAMSSDNYDSTKSKWNAKCGSSKLAYEIKNMSETTTYKTGDTILTATAGSVSATASVVSSYGTGAVLYAGRYVDTLTFTVAISNAN